MTIAFDTFLKESKTFVEEKLVSYANELQCPNVLREAMAYSLEAGGKRLARYFYLQHYKRLIKKEILE